MEFLDGTFQNTQYEAPACLIHVRCSHCWSSKQNCFSVCRVQGCLSLPNLWCGPEGRTSSKHRDMAPSSLVFPIEILFFQPLSRCLWHHVEFIHYTSQNPRKNISLKISENSFEKLCSKIFEDFPKYSSSIFSVGVKIWKDRM